MRAKGSVEIPGHVTLSLDVICALLVRPYIDRFFFHNTLRAIQLSVLLHILTAFTFVHITYGYHAGCIAFPEIAGI